MIELETHKKLHRWRMQAYHAARLRIDERYREKKRLTSHFYHRDNRELERERAKISGKIYNRQLKIETIREYGAICAICGESHIECLTIDHSFKDGAIFRKESGRKSAGVNFYRWLKSNNYPKNLGLRVLCFNCNCSIGYCGYSPYERINK